VHPLFLLFYLFLFCIDSSSEQFGKIDFFSHFLLLKMKCRSTWDETVWKWSYFIFILFFYYYEMENMGDSVQF